MDIGGHNSRGMSEGYNSKTEEIKFWHIGSLRERLSLRGVVSVQTNKLSKQTQDRLKERGSKRALIQAGDIDPNDVTANWERGDEEKKRSRTLAALWPTSDALDLMTGQERQVMESVMSQNKVPLWHDLYQLSACAVMAEKLDCQRVTLWIWDPDMKKIFTRMDPYEWGGDESDSDDDQDERKQLSNLNNRLKCVISVWISSKNTIQGECYHLRKAINIQKMKMRSPSEREMTKQIDCDLATEWKQGEPVIQTESTIMVPILKQVSDPSNLNAEPTVYGILEATNKLGATLYAVNDDNSDKVKRKKTYRRIIPFSDRDMKQAVIFAQDLLNVIEERLAYCYAIDSLLTIERKHRPAPHQVYCDLRFQVLQASRFAYLNAGDFDTFFSVRVGEEVGVSSVSFNPKKCAWTDEYMEFANVPISSWIDVYIRCKDSAGRKKILGVICIPVRQIAVERPFYDWKAIRPLEYLQHRVEHDDEDDNNDNLGWAKIKVTRYLSGTFAKKLKQKKAKKNYEDIYRPKPPSLWSIEGPKIDRQSLEVDYSPKVEVKEREETEFTKNFFEKEHKHIPLQREVDMSKEQFMQALLFEADEAAEEYLYKRALELYNVAYVMAPEPEIAVKIKKMKGRLKLLGPNMRPHEDPKIPVRDVPNRKGEVRYNNRRYGSNFLSLRVPSKNTSLSVPMTHHYKYDAEIPVGERLCPNRKLAHHAVERKVVKGIIALEELEEDSNNMGTSVALPAHLS